jgi:bifunctional non-homologous end joining protein LigD
LEHERAKPVPAKTKAPARVKAPAKPRRAKPKPGWAIPHDAVPGPMPDGQAPMLASSADAPPDGPEWVSEIKFDGYRLLVEKSAGRVRLLTRNGLDWTRRFAAIAEAVAALPAETLLADGEVVALREDGVSSFAMLQQALSDGRTGGLVLYLFDLLYRDGMDLRGCSLEERKAALEDLPHAGSPLRFSEHLAGVAAAMRVRACAMGLEGIICKRIDSPYKAGRGRAWLKVKCQGREEFVVLGFTRPQGSRSGLGALQLGYYDPKGKLHYAGGCGSGFSDAVLADLGKRLAADKTDRPADLLLTDEPPPRGVTWVTPSLVVEVQFTAWSGAGRLRHAVFLGLRQDKAPREVVRDIPDPEAKRHRLGGADESPVVVTARKPLPRKNGPRKNGPRDDGPRQPGAAKPRAPEAPAVMAGVKLTHPDRALWPGITKQDLAKYWHAVSGAALPGIATRPLAFVRCPDGIEGQHFFQKHASKGMPAGLHEGNFDGAPYLALDDEAGLAACAQIAAIELHAWGSTLDDPGRPDQLVFDLDPGEGTAWADVIAAAQDLRRRLDAAGLALFPRTSGGKGLHLLVPLTPEADWDTARAWCRTFAEACERDAPEKYVSSVRKAKRRGRILIDWLRNGLGSTAAASFSPRARPNATVATPLAWAEVTDSLDPQDFTIATVPKRLAKLRHDPWEGFEPARVRLPEAKENKRG